MSDPSALWEFKPQVWASGLTFPEAPTWHRNALWVTDVAEGGVHRFDEGGVPAATYLSDRKGMGGLIPTRDGDLLASGRDLVRVSDGHVVRRRPAGTTGLNDMGTSSAGELFVGVLTFRPVRGEPPRPGAVARLSKDGDDWEWWTGPEWPNGIAATPDGGLVLAEFSHGQLWQSAPPDADAVRSPSWVPVAASPTGHVDGLAVDRSGRIWVATGPGGGIEYRGADGELIGTYPLEAAFVSSVCFGGPDLGTLFITASGYRDLGGVVLAAAAPSPGLPVTPADL